MLLQDDLNLCVFHIQTRKREKRCRTFLQDLASSFNYNILSFWTFSSLLFIMSCIVLPFNAWTQASICRTVSNVPWQNSDFQPDIFLFYLEERGLPCWLLSSPACLVWVDVIGIYVIGRHFWIGILGFLNKYWDISAPHEPSNSP